MENTMTFKLEDGILRLKGEKNESIGNIIEDITFNKSSIEIIITNILKIAVAIAIIDLALDLIPIVSESLISVMSLPVEL